MLIIKQFIYQNLLFQKIYLPLHCVFHSIRFKVNKGWVRALTLFYIRTSQPLVTWKKQRRDYRNLIETESHLQGNFFRPYNQIKTACFLKKQEKS